MRKYGEIRIAENGGYRVREIVWDFLGLLLCTSCMIFLLFVAGGR